MIQPPASSPVPPQCGQALAWTSTAVLQRRDEIRDWWRGKPALICKCWGVFTCSCEVQSSDTSSSFKWLSQTSDLTQVSVHMESTGQTLRIKKQKYQKCLQAVITVNYIQFKPCLAIQCLWMMSRLLCKRKRRELTGYQVRVLTSPLRLMTTFKKWDLTNYREQ